ncbi:MAG: SDR family NAD(P)-dependent oxidoreductase [Actinomycetota bacterium]|nr:SDR family NAD(P)-dependent oxidoreductase [Actinomycetota bacterium]
MGVATTATVASGGYCQGVDLRGARVLVTGASRGIGEAIAREAGRRGAKVVGVARSAAALNAVMQSVNGVAFPCDLSEPAQRNDLIGRLEAIHGPIDVVVNNAGVDNTKLFAQASALDVERVITLNQVVPIELMRQAVPLMRSRGHGHVVNISSLAAAGGFAGMTLYCSSKAGLSGFHRVLRHELKGSPIGLSLVEIGPIPTDMLANVKNVRAAERMFNRLRRLQLLPEVPRERVAKAVCDAIERNTANVCLPKRAKIYPISVGLPQRIVNLITSDIKR